MNRLHLGPVSLQLNAVPIAYCLLSFLGLLIISVCTLTFGDLGLRLAELPSALFGYSSGKSAFVLERIRGPRLATAILAGALLGLSGTLFQTVTRNPLGSPDVIGVGAGAGAGAAISSLLIPIVPASVGAVGGAALATLLVYVFTGRGFRSSAHIILAGIGVSTFAYALTQYVVSTHLHDKAAVLAGYLVGSLNAVNLCDVTVTGLALLLLLPTSFALSTNISLLEIGDEAATGLGVNPDRTRTQAIVISVIASGTAVSAIGPVAFVALTAPQIARRLIRSSQVNIASSALTGALILATADLAAQHLPLLTGLPVGILTLGIGGLYLGYLLTHEKRKEQ
ncbi:iron chelate uptake ABC transporter family permease subunit [Trueperella pyogenes]|uniref:FecCD family ABC transporter permease n=1 Tax=Trueperella pyogenes TaxID=1661 RepID=UPI00345D3BFC